MMMQMGNQYEEEDDEEEGSLILEEEIDENYEPSNQEIIEYANFLGIDLQEDRDLLYIAKEALKAPLPDPWKPC
jgi:centrosomal protein CEP164